MNKKYISRGGAMFFIISVFSLFLSCASTPSMPSPFDEFYVSFNQQKDKTEYSLNNLRSLVNSIPGYEARPGSLSASDYDISEKIFAEIPGMKNNIESQIQSVKSVGHSITSDGYYPGTKEKIKGWDQERYVNLNVEQTILSLNKGYLELLAVLTEYLLNNLRSLVNSIPGYEARVGSLSASDYDISEKIFAEIPGMKNNIESQIQSVKSVGHSITSDGYYPGTKEKIKGWDQERHVNLNVEQTISSLNKNYSEILAILNAVDMNLIKRPNKEFSINAQNAIEEAIIELSIAKTDLASRNFDSGKNSVERTNNAIRKALRSNPNDIQQYQISLIQKEIEPVSLDISIGAGINKAGELIQGVVEGGTGILEGGANILKGLGNMLKKE
ncbi:MAG: hypothetical protein LBG57_00975 [Treponema sp.]|nr:hypothetical protein [Treponema sp.]